MILVRNIRLPLSAAEPQAFEKALHTLRVPRSKVEHTGVAKLSVDARHGQPKLVYTVAVAGVHREPGDAQMAHLSPGDAGEAEGFFVGLRLPGGEGQANIMDQDHILSYFLSCTAPHSCPAQKFCRWPAHRGGRRCSAGRWRHRSRRRRSQ